MAYTVEDAIAAVGSAQAAEQQSSTFWYVLASVTITDTEPGQLFAHPDPDFPTHITDEGAVELVDEEAWTPITGQGPLFREPLFGPTVDSLGDLFSWAWDGYGKVTVRRGAAGAPFLLGLSIEPVITLGPLSFRPPAFARSFVQRLDILRRNHYRGLLALQGQPQFTAALIEDPVNPKLTGTITPSPTVPGVIHPPASIEIILESLGSFTIG